MPVDFPPEVQVHDHTKQTNRTRSIWLSTAHKYTGTQDTYGYKLGPDADQALYYGFAVPKLFVSFSKLYVYHFSSIASDEVVLDIATYYRALGESSGFHSDTDNGNAITIADTNVTRFETSGLLSNLALGDTGLVYVNRDADNILDNNIGNLIILGVLIEYTADM